jgi:hypothetical protein
MNFELTLSTKEKYCFGMKFFSLCILCKFAFLRLQGDNLKKTRPAWAGFKTAEEGKAEILLIYTVKVTI